MAEKERLIAELENYELYAAHFPHLTVDGKLILDILRFLRGKPELKFFVDSDGKMTPLPIREHGHWKGFTQARFYGMEYGEPVFRDGRFYVCSECRRKSIIKYPYCPRCGAKMDAEVKQNEMQDRI